MYLGRMCACFQILKINNILQDSHEPRSKFEPHVSYKNLCAYKKGIIYFSASFHQDTASTAYFDRVYMCWCSLWL